MRVYIPNFTIRENSDVFEAHKQIQVDVKQYAYWDRLLSLGLASRDVEAERELSKPKRPRSAKSANKKQDQE